MYPSFLKVIEGEKESRNLAAILVVICYGMGINGCFYIAIVAAIFGCLGAIFSRFNLHYEERKMRNRTRVLVEVNGVLALAFPIFYLACSIVFRDFQVKI